MKLVELHTRVGKDGRIVVPEDIVKAAKFRPGDDVCVSLEDRQCDEDDLHVPVEFLEAAGIPEGSDLEIICTAGAIVIMEADILDNLPEDLRGLFGDLGISPDTVREVMRKEGYFV